MNMTGLVMIFLAFAIIKPMVLTSFGDEPGQSAVTFALPTFPQFGNITGLFNFVGVGGFNSIAEATENIAIAIRDFVIVLYEVVKFLILLIVYFGKLLLYVTVNAFTGIRGAPTYVNILLATPGLFMLGIISYRLIRSGDSDD